MNIKSRTISFLLLVISVAIFSGCGSRAVPTEDETKNAIESTIINLTNSSPTAMFSPVRVKGIDSFKLLEVYDHNYDFSQLTEKVKSKVDLKYLNTTKDMFKGDYAIVKASYIVRYGTAEGAYGAVLPKEVTQSQWFLLQKPEDGTWSVGMPLTEPVRD